MDIFAVKQMSEENITNLVFVRLEVLNQKVYIIISQSVPIWKFKAFLLLFQHLLLQRLLKNDL